MLAFRPRQVVQQLKCLGLIEGRVQTAGTLESGDPDVGSGAHPGKILTQVGRKSQLVGDQTGGDSNIEREMAPSPAGSKLIDHARGDDEVMSPRQAPVVSGTLLGPARAVPFRVLAQLPVAVAQKAEAPWRAAYR